MFNNNYTIKEIKQKVDEFSEYDDFRGAYECYKELKEKLEESRLKQTDPKLYGQYYNLLVKLKFLSLNFFDDWGEVEKLLKNHFEAVYNINYYNLWNKLKINLLTVPDLKKRDEIKNSLKKALLSCNRIIIDKEKNKDIKNFPKTVAEWLNDFNINLGIGKIDNLKKIKYLTNGENVKKLSERDKNRIKYLLNLYEKLKFSSLTPQGFEEDVPIVIEGKFYIFKQGVLEPIGHEERTLSGIPKSEEEKSLDELKQMAKQYEPGSLERKAIEEEMRKLGVR